MTLDLAMTAGVGDLRLDAAFSAADGETIALVGPNGAGKTTLLRAVAGLLPATGRVVVDGRDITGLPPHRRGVGWVPQQAALFPHLSALDNVAFPLGGRTGRPEAQRLLDRLGVGDLAGARPKALSGGQAQRVALARALAGRPAVIIADEITSALDVSTQGAVLNLVRDLQRELRLSMLFISHNLAVVRYVADHVAVMYRGRIVEHGPAGQVLIDPAHDYTRELLAAVPRPGTRLDPDTPGVTQ